MIILQKKTNKYNLNWPEIPDHSYRILKIVSTGSGKTNALLNLIKQQDDVYYSIINKIDSYVRDPNEAKYQYFIKKHEKLILNI